MVRISLFLSRSRHDNTIRAEARTGVVGSLKAAMDRLEQIGTELGDVSIESSTRQVADVREQIDRIITNLRDDNDPSFVADGLCAFIRKVLPIKPPRRPDRRYPADELVALYRRERTELVTNLSRIARRGT